MNNEKPLFIDIREVFESDLGSLYSLFSQLNPNLSFEEFKYNYKQAKEYKLFKAVVNQTPVGLIGYVFNRDLCVGRAMYIDVLVIDKAYRKKGIAKQLMNFALTRLHQDKNARCMRWTTRNDLKEAIGFYKDQIKEPIGYYYRIDNPYFGK